jgi:hypothetical protein
MKGRLDSEASQIQLRTLGQGMEEGVQATGIAIWLCSWYKAEFISAVKMVFMVTLPLNFGGLPSNDDEARTGFHSDSQSRF